MRKFKFSLQTVWDFKTQSQHAIELEIQSLEKKISNARLELAEVNRELHIIDDKVIKYLDESHEVDFVMKYQRYKEFLYYDMENRRMMIKKLENLLEKTRENYFEIYKECKSLDSLKDREFERWNKENLKEEQAMLDETGSIAYNRHVRESGKALVIVICTVMVLAGAAAILFFTGALKKKSFVDTEGMGKNHGVVESATEEVSHEAAVNHTTTVEAFSDLRERGKKIAEKEAQLRKWEEDLKLREKYIEDKEKSLAEMQSQVRTELETLATLKETAKLETEAEKQAQIDKLVKIYSNTRPKEAAQILLNFNPEFVAKIISSMRERDAGKIIQEMGKVQPTKVTEIMQFVEG